MLAVAAAVAALSTTLLSGVPVDANAGSGTAPVSVYEITVSNNTSGQYLTPPNWAVHSLDVDVFQTGQPASAGVEAVAERGGVGILEDELLAAVDGTGEGVSGVGAAAPIGPGESVTFTAASRELYLSVVSMIICTNDGFGGVDSVALPFNEGQTKTYILRDYDAGTEVNTENRDDIVPAPFCSTPAGAPGGFGGDQPAIDENGVITRHPSQNGVGDMPDNFDWRRGSVGSISVTKINQPFSYSGTVENLTGGQYFTPPNFAAHDASADVWSLDQAPSAGVSAVAELGNVPLLADELEAAIDDAGLGVSGVVDGPAGPIGPGEARSFDFTTDASRLSIVSMIICTNDGFAGLDSDNLPAPGETATYYLMGYDAGAEINTELREDIVPAPFCSTPAGTPGGNGADQPEIDGGNRITRHQTFRGIGDMPDSFDWEGPILKVTVTNNG
ncbi:MAG: spondin domain-containing protein [Actinomycetota bacterium]